MNILGFLAKLEQILGITATAVNGINKAVAGGAIHEGKPASTADTVHEVATVVEVVAAAAEAVPGAAPVATAVETVAGMVDGMAQAGQAGQK